MIKSLRKAINISSVDGGDRIKYLFLAQKFLIRLVKVLIPYFDIKIGILYPRYIYHELKNSC